MGRVKSVRPGVITTSAMDDIVRASKIITQDVVEDGGEKIDARKFIMKLVRKGVGQV